MFKVFSQACQCSLAKAKVWLCCNVCKASRTCTASTQGMKRGSMFVCSTEGPAIAHHTRTASSDYIPSDYNLTLRTAQHPMAIEPALRALQRIINAATSRQPSTHLRIVTYLHTVPHMYRLCACNSSYAASLDCCAPCAPLTPHSPMKRRTKNAQYT
jgi:hypothetical protein